MRIIQPAEALEQSGKTWELDLPVYSALVYSQKGGTRERKVSSGELCGDRGPCCEERAHQMQLLKIEPRWDLLRTDPRFVDVVRRTGFTE